MHVRDDFKSFFKMIPNDITWLAVSLCYSQVCGGEGDKDLLTFFSDHKNRLRLLKIDIVKNRTSIANYTIILSASQDSQSHTTNSEQQHFIGALLSLFIGKKTQCTNYFSYSGLWSHKTFIPKFIWDGGDSFTELIPKKMLHNLKNFLPEVFSLHGCRIFFV